MFISHHTHFFETALRSCIIDVCMKRGQRMAKNIKKISILRHGLHLLDRWSSGCLERERTEETLLIYLGKFIE